jgi:hypothetical protein
MGAVAAAVMIRKEKELVAHFQSLRAVSPETARPQQDFADDSSNAWRRLFRHAVIRQAPGGTWYLDELSWEALRNTRRRVITIILIAVIVAFLVGYIPAMLAGRPK